MKKRIKPSNRGLTFSLPKSEISVGTRYRYIVDTSNRQILIIPDENGRLKVSKKKVGEKIKPLFDIRSKEVRELVSEAGYLEVEICDNQIVVTAYKKQRAGFRLVKNKICTIDEVLGVKSGQIIVPMAMAAGSEYHQMTFTDWFQTVSNVQSETVVKTVSKDMSAIYDVVSLFSGAGLFDKSWLDTGRFRFVYANDFCADVVDTYTYNIGNHMHCKDVRNVSGLELPFADVFSASPCCQAFSNANRHNMDSEEAEEKRLLVEEVVRLALETQHKPKVIVVENVPQMMTKEKGLYINKLLEGLPEYESSVQIVTDYKCGGFTKRQRCIVILSRIGKITLPEMEILPYKTVKDALSKVDATWVNFNDYSEAKEETIAKMRCVPQGGNWKNIPKEVFEYGPKTHSSIMRRLSYDEIAPTITNVRKNNMMPPEGNRCLSVAEAAALMGLKKDFHFLGELSAMQQAVANGVTQAIGKLVAKTVAKALDNYNLTLQTI